MSQQDRTDTGIPTRAIHEAYLNLQQTHRQFRRSVEQEAVDTQVRHGAYQDSVLTFYELIRPHLKRKSGMSRFWEGELPEYPDQPWASFDHAAQYCRQYGVAVWNCQKHVDTAPAASAGGPSPAVADGSGTLSEWHDRLGLGEKQRVVGIHEEQNILAWVELRAVSGLKQLDRWDTRVRQSRDRGDGFMAGETSTTTSFEYVDPWKLTKAKRLLAEAADKMQLLSRVDIDHEDGAIVNFDMSREDTEPEYRTAEYSSSPEI